MNDRGLAAWLGPDGSKGIRNHVAVVYTVDRRVCGSKIAALFEESSFSVSMDVQ